MARRQEERKLRRSTSRTYPSKIIICLPLIMGMNLINGRRKIDADELDL